MEIICIFNITEKQNRSLIMDVETFALISHAVDIQCILKVVELLKDLKMIWFLIKKKGNKFLNYNAEDVKTILNVFCILIFCWKMSFPLRIRRKTVNRRSQMIS